MRRSPARPIALLPLLESCNTSFSAGVCRAAGGRADAVSGVLRALFSPRCFRHQLLLPRPYLVLTKPLRLDIQCQRGASVKIGWKYLDD